MHEPLTGAESIFIDFLARRDAGEQVDIDSLVAAHPALAEGLRGHYRDWLAFAPLLENFVPGPLARSSGAPIEPNTDAHVQVRVDERPSLELIRKLQSALSAQQRYVYHSLVGRGGMGAVLRVRDRQLNRTLAMKVVIGRDGRGAEAAKELDSTRLARFLEEAQITGQLDHPGVVPVHELGTDAHGRAYFTMRLVKGENFARVIEAFQAGADGWTLVRALGVLQRACETVAYAHARRVVHRDLKPANVMVGRFGEVYVMDWGLARVLSAEESDRVGGEVVEPRTLRTQLRETHPRWASLSLHGDVLGSPFYMSPEQARGHVERIGFASDVYSLGAILYHLLAGRAPYEDQGPWSDSWAVVERIRDRPPTDLTRLADRAPAELVSIADRCMARDPAQRYSEVRVLADDLRAFLENRVVSAHAAGAWAETRKWVARNKLLAASLAGTVAVSVVGGVTGWSLSRKALAGEMRADAFAERLERERNALASARKLEQLTTRGEELWPAHPELVPAYERWLAEARDLLQGAPADLAFGARQRDGLAQLKLRLSAAQVEAPGSPGQAPPSESALGVPWRDVASNENSMWWRETLADLVTRLEALQDAKTGLLGDTLAEPYGWGIDKRLAFARTIAERSVSGPDARRRWDTASRAIRDSSRYGGLELRPQMGLLPIGEDPHSGLWEFAHLQSGEIPQRGADGKLVVASETCIVLVLIPGGGFWMGAQATHPTGQNFDADAHYDEGPPHSVTVSPYFVAKFEMTQGQWVRIAGVNPSSNAEEYASPCVRHDLRHPVEQISLVEATRMLARLGLTVPSEAQWERACRAGTTTPWSSGAERESLRGRGNFADRTAQRAGMPWIQIGDWPDLDDGWCAHAPVGSYEPNGFGLHDFHGNVFEWCLDAYSNEFYSVGPVVDPLNPRGGASKGVQRGGSFFNAAKVARSSYRLGGDVTGSILNCGVRPARAVDK